MIKHILYDDLIPQQERLEYLFIGTFNPNLAGNDAQYFYGRPSNFFWCILPHAFEENCLINETPEKWKAFCLNKKIGLTDLIKCIHADANNIEHKKAISTFRDNLLCNFEIEFCTEAIKNIIVTNKETLKGVFFTRKTSSGISKIWSEWQKIKKHCEEQGISNCDELLSPSLQGNNIRATIKDWRNKIKIDWEDLPWEGNSGHLF